MKRNSLLILTALLLFWHVPLRAADEPLRIATFQIDATPPIGSPLCNGSVKPANEIVTPLTARGVILLGAGQPIVLCAFDWVGIANESHDAFREALAEAVGTSRDRVTVHTLHQHDAPGSDFATERLLAEHGLGGRYSNAGFDRQVMQRLAAAAKESLSKTQAVTHLGLGAGKVERVASNRRILGADGRVAVVRMSASRKPEAQAAPEGTIDPLVRLIAFWNGEQPVAALTYYATHPQSYYGQGSVNWDTVGMARELREKALPGVAHIHFDGAGGNVAAGKYNDGSKENRPVLAQRLADGMKLAWDSQKKQPLGAADVGWEALPVAMPVRDTLIEPQLLTKLKDTTQQQLDRIRAARDLTFLQRTRGGHQIPLSCLRLDSARVLHMPGELFVEYQLAAQRMRPDSFVAMAAYGDYGPGYIGTEIAYGQGGYETGIVSRVAPQVERVLMDAMQRLLGDGAGEFKVGAAQVDITPANGTPMAGYYKFRAVGGVLDPIFAKAIVVEQDGARAAFVVLDLSGTTRPLVAAARKAIEEQCHLSGDRVMISATHTHTGPQLPRGSLMDDITKANSPAGLTYMNALPGLIAKSVSDAIANLAPARASATVGKAEGISFNRRVIGKDGKCIWQPRKIDPAVERPAGPVDPDLGLLVFDSVESRPSPVAAYVNFAMHPTSVGGGVRISADYPGVLTKLLQERKGGKMIAVFANGCCGNINHTDYLSGNPQRNTLQLGTALADVATQSWPALQPMKTCPPRARSTTVTLQRRKFSEEDVAKAKDVANRMFTENLGTVSMAEAVCILETIAKQDVPLEAEVQAIVFSDDLAIVALPGEIFVELGLALKAASPFKHTFIAELANGSIGYIPNRAAYPQGNYEVVSARGAEGSGERLVDEALKLLKELAMP